MKYVANAIVLSVVFAILTGCATKNFGKLPALDPSVAESMTCQEIEREFYSLQQYEESVDEEAASGQVKQIFWGGIWSVMADEKLEHIARKDIRNRLRLLYDLKIKKGCQ